ncbi:hypothetical protein B0H19DRAFT_1377976 [Mycena capillaripes]|nr:hypothetical protein B0H19DRAFT_1377976 [Mycena capillaripes]
MSLHLSPSFPPELELEIFETTAELYPGTIPSLLLVSQRVYEWIERIKYNTVTTAGEQSSCRFRVLQRLIQSNSKPTSFHDCVRHLLHFDDPEEDEDVSEILSVCSGIRSLALFGTDWEARPEKLDKLEDMKLRRLTIALQSLLVDVEPRPILAFVTHLDITDHIPSVSRDDFARWLSFLALLPALTHLALYDGFTMVADALASCKRLEVLICMHTW